MDDEACEFARAAVRSNDAQKQLARTSLIPIKSSYVLSTDHLSLAVILTYVLNTDHLSLAVILCP